VPTLLTDLVLDEVSLVDVPANPGATVLLYKRGKPAMEEPEMAEFTPCAGCVTKAVCMTKGMCMSEKMTKGDPSTAELTTALDAALSDIDTLKGEIAKRDAELAAIKAAAPVEKQAEPALPEAVQKRMDDMQKRLDEADAIVKAERAERAKVEATAKAERDLPYLPGEPVEKGAALVALADLPRATRETIEKMLAAGNKALADAMVEKGAPGGGDAGSAEQQLNDLARKRATDHNMPFAKAYSDTLADNPRLYNDYVTEKRQKVAKSGR
jgi:hypothetical protein